MCAKTTWKINSPEVIYCNNKNTARTAAAKDPIKYAAFFLSLKSRYIKTASGAEKKDCFVYTDTTKRGRE